LGADTFHFDAGDGSDLVTDFDPQSGDRLLLDTALWTGDRTAAEVVAAFAVDADGGSIALEFEGGERLWLRGFGDRAALEGAIDLV
jgi:Ca2+-binding RTX toxin-like protein